MATSETMPDSPVTPTTTTATATVTTTSSYWTFRGHQVYTEKSTTNLPKQVDYPTNDNDKEQAETTTRTTTTRTRKKKTLVLLVHGFACSSTYWRETKRALLQNQNHDNDNNNSGGGHAYEVHSLDLLGQGQSDKPGRAQGIDYSIHLWAEQVDAYIKENMIRTVSDDVNDDDDDPSVDTGPDIILCGNSLGSLVVLSAVTGDFKESKTMATPGNDNDKNDHHHYWNHRCKGICMFNCGVGLNSRGIANEEQWTPFQRFLIHALYNVLDVLIFRNTALLAYVLDTVVTRDLLRRALVGLYPHRPDRVDDELVDSFYHPAKDCGSVEALGQIYTNEPGATPMDLHRKYGTYYSSSSSTMSWNGNSNNDKNKNNENKNTILDSIPIHLIWGDKDAVTPLIGGVGQYYQTMALNRDHVSFQVVSAGHIPFDDNPIDSHESMVQWLDQL